MKTYLLLSCAGLCWLGACSSPEQQTPVTAPPPASTPASWPLPVRQDYQRLLADQRRVQAADSALEADHATARAMARDAGLAATAAFRALEQRHTVLLARHRQVQRQHAALLRDYARLGSFSAEQAATPPRLRALHDTLRQEQQRLAVEYRSLLTDRDLLRAEHAALLENAGY